MNLNEYSYEKVRSLLILGNLKTLIRFEKFGTPIKNNFEAEDKKLLNKECNLHQ